MNSNYKYFIEHKKTRLWWYSTFEEVNNGSCHCHPHLYFSMKRFKDGWTNDPNKAEHFNTYKEAQHAIWFFYTNESEKNLMVTEHEFVGNITLTSTGE